LSILKACQNTPLGTQELLVHLGYKTRTGNFKKALASLENELNFIEKTLPDAVQSKNQKYRLTEKGKHMLKKLKGSSV